MLLAVSCARPWSPPPGATAAPPPRSEPAHAVADPLLRATVDEWRGAHDEHDRKRLEKLYATHVRYQGFELERDVVLRFKEADFARSPSTRRSVDDLRADVSRRDLPRLAFRTTTKGPNRIVVEDTTLTVSCDRRAARDCDGVPCQKGDAPYCEIVAEEGSAFLDALARGRDLASHAGSCPAALAALAASTEDAKAIVAGRPLATSTVPVAIAPEWPRHAVALLDDEGTPKALYTIDPSTFEMLEVLPGDIAQKGDSGLREKAKRACGQR